MLFVFVLTSTILCIFTPKLINNFLITVVSCFLPALAGISLNMLININRSSRGIRRFLHIYGGAFSCIHPAVLLLCMYYFSHIISSDSRMLFLILCIALSLCTFGYTKIVLLILPLYSLASSIGSYSFLMLCVVFSLSFLGYIPANNNPHYSLMKNNIIGIIDLFSTIFMWSFVSSYISFPEALRFCQSIVSTSFNTIHYIPLLLKVTVILILLKALKLIAEEFDDFV